MPNFQKPNLTSDPGGHNRGPYVSIRSDKNTVGLSKAAQEKLGASEGAYLHLALDSTYRPWVAVLEEPTSQGEPQIRADGDGGRCVNSTLLNRQLRRLIDGDAEGVFRFYLAGETTEDPETGATLHRLEVPEA